MSYSVGFMRLKKIKVIYVTRSMAAQPNKISISVQSQLAAVKFVSEIKNTYCSCIYGNFLCSCVYRSLSYLSQILSSVEVTEFRSRLEL
jgi:hypothetical protein